MSEQLTTLYQKAANSLPPFWKLATIRCCIYALVVGSSAFISGVEGYDSLSQMSNLQLIKLGVNITVSVAGVWVAFLDQTLQQINKPTNN